MKKYMLLLVFIMCGPLSSASDYESNSLCTETETRTTYSGYVFVRDCRYPELGEAWRDPIGLIWGDIVRDVAGKSLWIEHPEAKEYCKKIGGVIPSVRDFVRLQQYFSTGPHTYRPQVLPGIIPDPSMPFGRYQYWAKEYDNSAKGYYYFDSRDGYISSGAGSEPESDIDESSFRCVKNP